MYLSISCQKGYIRTGWLKAMAMAMANIDTYDYVVVAGGTAGRVLTGRLTQHSDMVFPAAARTAPDGPTDHCDLPTLIPSAQETPHHPAAAREPHAADAGPAGAEIRPPAFHSPIRPVGAARRSR